MKDQEKLQKQHEAEIAQATEKERRRVEEIRLQKEKEIVEAQAKESQRLKAESDREEAECRRRLQETEAYKAQEIERLRQSQQTPHTQWRSV